MNRHHAQAFKALHQAKNPLLLTNVWDAASAAMVAKMGAPAVATSSATLAWSLGHQDGQQLPIESLLAAVERITAVLDRPLTVDIEAGYSADPAAVVALVNALIDLGVVGINIEDGAGPMSALVEKIQAIRTQCHADLFINARTDVYLQRLVADDRCLGETMQRASAYVAAGADGCFVPGLLDMPTLGQLVSAVDAPLNVMVSDRIDGVAELAAGGVARISCGPAPFLDAYAQLQHWVPQAACAPQQPTLSFNDVNDLLQRS